MTHLYRNFIDYKFDISNGQVKAYAVLDEILTMMFGCAEDNLLFLDGFRWIVTDNEFVLDIIFLNGSFFSSFSS